MTLTILTWNTLVADRDGANDARARIQAEVIADLAPDIFLMQEAKGFDAGGGALLHDLEARLGMRGFLAVAPRTGQNVAIFIRAPLVPVAFEADGAHFHHALARLTVRLPGGIDRPLTLMSAHLCPNGPVVRRREAAYLAVLADPAALTLLTGDFNSISPHDPEPAGFADLPAHHRARYLAEDLIHADRSVMAQFNAAGWVDLGHRLDPARTPTVPGAAFVGTEFPTMRCDFMLASEALAAHAQSYEVIRTPATDRASDHYPVLARFKVTA